MDGLQNWARTELERRQVKIIDEAITQAETLTDFKHDRLDKAKGKEAGAVKLKAGETVAEVETRPSPMADGLNVRSTRRSGRIPAMETGAIYAADHTVMPGAQR